MTLQNSDYVLFGKSINKYIRGDITFDRLIESFNSHGYKDEFKNSEAVKSIWHILFQYQTDVCSEDKEYVAGVTYWLMQVSVKLMTGEDGLDRAIENYHNNPLIRIKGSE